MQDQLYDQFGNYIGPQIPQPVILIQQSFQENISIQQQPNITQNKLINQHKIVLNQDKKYYPSHQEFYADAQTLIQQQDRQPLQAPILPSKKIKQFDLVQTNPNPLFQIQFMHFLSKYPNLLRNVAIAGNLHHGKTLLMDMLVKQTHLNTFPIQQQIKWTDTRRDQHQRQISIKSTLCSLIISDSKGKSHLINFIDTPGHPNFHGQFLSILRLIDCVVVVVDVVEGIILETQRILRQCVKENVKIIIILNKLDRLILELKLPPQDAYFKIRNTIQQINIVVQSEAAVLNIMKVDQLRVNIINQLSPLLGNVLFSSTLYHFIFSIDTFVDKYKSQYLRKVCWGDYFYNSDQKKYMKKASIKFRKRTFVEFILQPIYKIFSHVVSCQKQILAQFLQQINVQLTNQQYNMNIKELLRSVFQKFFKNCNALIDSIRDYCPSAQIANSNKVHKYYTGSLQQKNILQKCSPQGPLFIYITKLIHNKDCKQFDAIGRIISGTVHKNQLVKILGQKYTLQEQQDFQIKHIKNISFSIGRYRFPIHQANAGNIIMLEGIDQNIIKTACVVDSDSMFNIFTPLNLETQSIIKLAIQPLVPSQLPKMITAIRQVSKSYPHLITKVEQSGEHVLMSTGQLQFDCIMHDIRKMYSDIEIKVSDPCVCFRETVIATSAIKCYADTPNKKNRISFISSPLQKGLDYDIEKEKIKITDSPKYIRKYLQQQFQWDILAASNVWAFGPNDQGPNVLINDSIPSENTDQNKLNQIKNNIIQGFRWAIRQGPLCDQPIRNLKFRIIQAQLANHFLQLTPGQIIPTTRRACYSSFLMATPRMMEPQFYVQILCTSQCIPTIQTLLSKRRGHIISQLPKPGTPLYMIKATLPAIDSFGFQVDLRIQTGGQAFCLYKYDRWVLLQGDPLDKSLTFKPLQPSEVDKLPRQFMLKTRRRKGLNQEVSIIKYFDDHNIIQALKTDEIYKEFI